MGTYAIGITGLGGSMLGEVEASVNFGEYRAHDGQHEGDVAILIVRLDFCGCL